MTPPIDLSRAQWRTSSYTNGGEACVEVAGTQDFIAIRDSKNPSGSKLAFTAATWHDFSVRIRSGALDL
jgi:hypothetical protein